VVSAVLSSTLFANPVDAGKKPPSVAPPLNRTHHIASSLMTFRTPEDWVISGKGASPEVVDATKDDLIVRFLRWDNEAGLDSLHVTCLMERPGDPEALEPSVQYEYEFHSGERNEWRILDTAYGVQYDGAVRGVKDWRVRVVTLVGKGEAVCVVAFCPVPLWRGSKAARDTLEAVVTSVSLP
jgi:hypothetical protein